MEQEKNGKRKKGKEKSTKYTGSIEEML